MRPLVIIVNVVVLAFVTLQIIKMGLPKLSDGDFFVFILLFFSPCINLWYVCVGSKRDTWLSMYMTRKTLEEKKRIEELTKN
jgi:hypothetical protein